VGNFREEPDFTGGKRQKAKGKRQKAKGKRQKKGTIRVPPLKGERGMLNQDN